MTMFKQISLLFSIILLFILTLTLGVNFLDTKKFVENELYTKAQNDAIVLSVNMTMAKGDITKIKTIANAVFDNGFYKEISLKDMHGNILLEKLADEKPNVPRWFNNMISLSSSNAKAQVANKWTPLGILTVKMSSAKATEYLYHLFKNIVLIFIASYLFGIFFIYLLLKIIFKPLYKVQHQAEEVIKNRFEYQNELPSTVELRSVVVAINSMVGKMEKVYKSLQRVTRKNKIITYTDEVTGLANRKFFILKYNEYASSFDSRSNGVVFFVRISNALEANKIIGFNNVNEIYKNIAKILKDKTKDIEESLVCRVSGTEFGCIFPSVKEEFVKKLAKDIKNSFKETVEQFSEIKGLIDVYMVAKDYKQDQPLSSILSSVDFALNSLESDEKEHYRCIMTEKYSIAKTELRVLLQEALRSGHLSPKEFLLISLKGDKNIKFISFGVKDDKVGEIEYEVLIPTVKYYTLYDEYIMQECNYLSRLLPGQDISVEIDVSYFDNLTVVDKIIEHIKILKLKNINITVEIPQNNLNKMDSIKSAAIINKLKENDINLAISRFDGDDKVLEELYNIHPRYIRMYAEHFLDMNDVLKQNLVLMLKTAGIKIMLDKVEKEYEEKLKNFDIDYISLK